MSELHFEPFETYFAHVLLREHFTKDRFNFHVSYNCLRDRFVETWHQKTHLHQVYMNLTRKFKRPEEMRDHLRAVIVTHSPKTPYEELYDLDLYRGWLSRIHAMHDVFDEDLTRLKRAAGSVRKAVYAPDGEQPALYRLLMAGKVSMETFAWMAHLAPGILPVMDECFDPLDLPWQEKRLIALKYEPFLTRLNIDENRLGSILRGHVWVKPDLAA